ncbi:MAG TPA: hypothetical protein VF791_20110 [Pyrinomonadaceae bacterium]
MNKIFTIFFAATLFVAVQFPSKAQDDPRPFNPLAESVAKAIQEQFPDWKRTSVPPINKNEPNKFSEEVIIDQWKSDDAIVKVAILIHPSKEVAAETLKKFAADVRANGPLPDLDSESYVWGIDKSLAFRKGRYTVYISAVPIVFPEDHAPMDRNALLKETKFNKAIAHIVAKVLKDL